MGRKRKNSSEALLEELRGQQSNNEEIFSQSSDQENENDQHVTLDVIGTSQQNEPLFVTIIDTTTQDKEKKKMSANEVWHLDKKLKVIVELNGDGHGQDPGSNLLVRFLGKMARMATFCPIIIENWHVMPKAKKSKSWQLVEAHFLFDYVAGFKWVMRTLGDRWKSYKYELRCYFTKFDKMEDLLAHPPNRIDSGEWSSFVRHYCSEKMKAICSKNAHNRKKVKVPHFGGSKSNARKGSEMVKKLGRDVTRSEIKLATLLKKDGSYANDEARTLAGKIQEFLPLDQERVASSGITSKIFAEPDDAIGKVFGPEHPGRVRVMGIGSCPSSIFGLQRQLVNSQIRMGSSVNTTCNNGEGEGMIDLVNQVKTLQERSIAHQETLKELSETKVELQQTQSKFNTLLKFLQDKFGDDLPPLDQESSPP